MKIDMGKISQRRDELKTHKGFLPNPLTLFVSATERAKFLKSQGIFEEVSKQQIDYRNQLKRSNNKLDFRFNEFVKWVRSNPQFSDFLVED